MDEKIKSLVEAIRNSATDPFIREGGRAELDALILSELGQQITELTSELTTTRSVLKENSDVAAIHTAALVFWSKALVFVTCVYVLITAGLLWVASTN